MTSYAPAPRSAWPLLLLSLGFCLGPLAVLGCQASSAHDEVLFRCSPEKPQCPQDQSCNPQDNCCHPNSETDPSASLGKCQLAPGLTSSGVGTGSGTAPAETGQPPNDEDSKR